MYLPLWFLIFIVIFIVWAFADTANGAVRRAVYESRLSQKELTELRIHDAEETRDHNRALFKLCVFVGTIIGLFYNWVLTLLVLAGVGSLFLLWRLPRMVRWVIRIARSNKKKDKDAQELMFSVIWLAVLATSYFLFPVLIWVLIGVGALAIAAYVVMTLRDNIRAGYQGK